MSRILLIGFWSRYAPQNDKYEISNFIQHTFSSLLLFYLILFILENLFPGFVSNNFDLNIMLIPILSAGILSAFFPTPPPQPQPTARKDYLLAVFLTVLTFIIVFGKTRDLGSISYILAVVSSLLVLLISISVLFTDGQIPVKQLALPIEYPEIVWIKQAKRLQLRLRKIAASVASGDLLAMTKRRFIHLSTRFAQSVIPRSDIMSDRGNLLNRIGRLPRRFAKSGLASLLAMTVFLLFFILRLMPYLNNGIPTGYDAGIYIHVIKFFPNLPDWLIPQYYSFLFFLTYPIKLFGIGPQYIVVPFAILIQIFLLFSVYWILKKISGKQAAVTAAFILSISAIQNRTYWFFYLKYILSLIFLLYYLYFQGKKSYIRTSFFGILVAVTHLLTFSIVIAVALIDIVIPNNNRKRKIINLAAILFISFLFYLPYFNQTIIGNLLPAAANLISLNFIQKDSSGGTFYPIHISILLTAVYLPLAIYGIVKTTRAKREELRPFLITLSLTLFLIVIKASFFRRVFIITDLMLIIYSSFGFSLIKEIKKFYIVVLILFALIFTLKTSDKLIPQQNLQEISSSKLGNNYLLSTAREDSAWLLGYTNAKVIAWNFGGYDIYWNDTQWREFLSSSAGLEEKVKLLRLLPSQTIIYINDYTKKNLNDLINSGSLIPISKHFYRVAKNVWI